MHKSLNRVSIKFEKNLPKRMEESQLKILLSKARSGNAEAVQELITWHIRFVISIASGMSAKFPSKSDDILSVALEKLVIVTHGVANKTLMTDHDAFVPYLSTQIRFAIKQFIDQDYTVRPQTRQPKNISEIRNDPETFLLKNTGMPIDDLSENNTDLDDFYIRDLVEESLMFNDLEILIINELLKGTLVKEIAEKTGYTSSHISAVRKNMKPRLEKLTQLTW